MPGQSLGSLLEVAITDSSAIGNDTSDNATVDCFIDPVTTDIRVTTDCRDVTSAPNGCDMTEGQFFGLDLGNSQIVVPNTISYAACATGATDCSGSAAITTTLTATSAASNLVADLTAITDRTFNIT